jgi:hypothetical protein
MPTKNPTAEHLLDRCAIGLRALLCAGLCIFATMMLSACGPGTGGTGTGPSAVGGPTPFTNSYFTSSGAGTVTSAPLPNPVTPSTPTATPSLPASTCTAGCASNLDTQALSLYLQADSVTLSSPCATFKFAGPWSISASGEATLLGVLESTVTVNGQISRTSQSANLTLSFAGTAQSSASVSVRITNSAGRVLLNPVTLLPASDAPAALTPVLSAAGC